LGGSGLQLVQWLLTAATAPRTHALIDARTDALARRRYDPARRRGRLDRYLHRGADLSETTDYSLSALMVAAQAGDARAYQAMLRACVPLIASVARRQGIPRDRIDDVVQDVLLTIHRARATYDPARPFLPWLRAIATRRAIDALRLRYRQAAEIQDDEAASAAAAETPDADRALDLAGQSQLLADAIATLPPGQRQAVELLALRERTLEQAAGETGRSKVALKVNLHRAIVALRRRLAQTGDGQAGDGRVGDAEPGDAEPGNAEPGDLKPRDAERRDVRRGNAQPGGAQPGDARRGDS
jgi:RNA polymerase sigma-70 factor (ECF subfamily)